MLRKSVATLVDAAREQGRMNGLLEAAKIADEAELRLITEANSIDQISIASLGAAITARDIRARIKELIK